ncbi:hypothetical protein FQA39_LY07432 [Lamprigera yunnana]|nr:hypothetical protein FQA39_LY07432 [Lamprigera yunnana]
MENNFAELLNEKINLGSDLIKSTDKFNKLEGIQKLRRKIKQELTFLKNISNEQRIKKEHLQCSNLTHFKAVVATLNKIDNCQAVNKVFNLEESKLSVDIVCDDGLTWIKVIARNPKSLTQISLGDTSYGVRSVLDQANEYLKCAELNPCYFQKPKIVFVFFAGISEELAEKLQSLGVTVNGTHITQEIDSKDFTTHSNTLTDNTRHITKVNLDVSAMLAYVSSVTNGSCAKYQFAVPVLAQQAKWETERPVKPILDNYFKEKTLYCCETAKYSFIDIVNTVGGPNEKKRAEEFLKRIIVLPDNASTLNFDNHNEYVKNNVQPLPNRTLEVGGKIKERSLIIFQFGDRIQAVTVTANDGFIRAAKQQGFHFVVFVHESRALTEQKESKATKI